MNENTIMETKIIYESENFKVCVPSHPHVSKEEGGHIWIMGKKHYSNRYDLTPQEAIEVMRLTMLIGEAMIAGMKNRGVFIERINFQDNGNWAYLKELEPTFHIHLYGRTKDSKIQTWGEALRFPNPDTDFYDNLVPFNYDDIEEIKKAISNIENQEKYKKKNWNL